jgi:tetratricopeptide (TPR) repeat protein
MRSDMVVSEGKDPMKTHPAPQGIAEWQGKKNDAGASIESSFSIAAAVTARPAPTADRPSMPASSRPMLGCLAAWLLLCLPAAADTVSDVQGLIARGDLTAALQRAEAAARAEPRQAQPRFLRALVLLEMHRDGEAFDAFTQLSQDYPELAEPFNNLAVLHVRAGRIELARQALETSLRNDPTNRTARTNLGEVHLMLAVRAWEQAAAGGPLDPHLVRKLEAAQALIAAGASSAATAGR